ncbi:MULTISPECIES: FAD-binding dehydrogenase [unclassified Agrobacterium]|uniref:FAD-binding dehydrogenase n=1 Tax=unclassified Agrobacterium TaxID=2632611 RepID=UPI002449DB8B|nr:MULTISPECIES: FAD-binding dehydrogenase [unclassified Agrobacterium]MDH0612047.1 FAD-binding dehydrogenase [Agrobacterium sp. GD03872]MDH0695944.1 FAD-binding dehydrogenase [Agrobacterium sp. GD03871]MDH1058782.1 FAD-binding dehydrogenase [Agrobacterium sp. GD03992]MDH2210873.1 FAD-binding dehydrogenase [Agrobacterium sp. GD03643]MDH2217710.1 FAD-binding dehydrogenase [Agrobacterium sp. GD03638]
MEGYDVIVVGAGLAGLVAATEAAERGLSVCVVDQEGEQNLGGQAFWSLGGLFFVDSPEQRRMRVRDSLDLARQDWFGSAGFDRLEDYWPRRWAEAYLDFAAGEKREWLHRMGMRWFPVVGWAERGGSLADGHGNSVPRFHVTWGTGPGVLAPFVKKAKAMAATGRLTFHFRHRVDRLETADGRVTGVSGAVLTPDSVQRGQESSREAQGDFIFAAAAVIVSSGGIGGNQELVRRNWPVERLGQPPASMVCGVPAHVDGRMIAITETAGGAVINRDRMWHYTEGVKNHDPIWPGHGIRILPGPSSFWCDADGNRLAAPAMPGFDTLGTLKMLGERGSGHSWFILTKAIIKKEFALSGSEQNPDLTGKDIRLLLKRLGKEPPGPVRAFMERGEDFAVRDTLEELVAAMNAISGDDRLHIDHIRRQIEARDREIENGFSKDAQVTAIHGARRYLGDRLMRTAKPHRLLDPAMGPLIAVRLHVLTRKTLGGLRTDLEARVLDVAGAPVPGLYAAGEVAGFGGGGMHGYNALEGTFLGGCLFSGRVAGRKVLA